MIQEPQVVEATVKSRNSQYSEICEHERNLNASTMFFLEVNNDASFRLFIIK
jgi:hypothetical protein